MIVIQTRASDPRTVQYLQPDGSLGGAPSARLFKTFKAAEAAIQTLDLGDVQPVRIVSGGQR